MIEFEWDERKRKTNLRKHKLDFVRADILFDGRPVRTHASSRNDEERFVTIGQMENKLVALVWTLREGRIRVISLRRARHEEERQYRQIYN
jgi:uncharacterized protein